VPPLITYRSHSNDLAVLGLFLGFLILSALLKSWVVLCTTMGALVGAVIDQSNASTHHHRVTDTIVAIGVLTAVGFLVGLFADFMRHEGKAVRSKDSHDHQRNSTQTLRNSQT
jgi:predicted histidine transporter YuiF (NhaC family)